MSRLGSLSQAVTFSFGENGDLIISPKKFAEKKTIVVVGLVTTIYYAIAEVGTAEVTAAWQVQKKVIDTTTNTEIRITWADGNDLFDNVATDLTLLSYS